MHRIGLCCTVVLFVSMAIASTYSQTSPPPMLSEQPVSEGTTAPVVGVDYCAINPCLSGGVCTTTSLDNGYECSCLYGYVGANCDFFVGGCESSPCLNRGTCSPAGDGDYSCDCPPDFSGSSCEISTTMPPFTGYTDCPSDILVVTSLDEAQVSWSPPSATDALGLTTRSSTHCPGSLFPVGETEVLYFFIDDIMLNRAICRFNVIVIFENLEPIRVINCPVDGVSLHIDYIRDTPGSALGINPQAESPPETSVIREPNNDGLFGVGVTHVVYTFVDVNNQANRATCEFNVTIIPVCPDQTDTRCDYRNSPTLCIPSSTVSDCSERDARIVESSSSFLTSGDACQGPINCGDAELLDACTTPSDWLNAAAADSSEISAGAVFSFEVPVNAGESTHLTSVRVAWFKFDELYSPGIIASRRGVLVSVDVSVLSSSLTSQAVFWVYPELTRPNPAEVFLQVPLPVQPDDVVTIMVNYKDYAFASLDPCRASAIQSTSCLDCVSVQYRTRTADCGDDPCLGEYLEWLTAVSGGGMQSFGDGDFPPCRNNEYDASLMSILELCLPPAQFVFVSPSQTSSIGDIIWLQCVGTGPVESVEPVVEWYTGNEVRARGTGSAEIMVFVNEISQNFTCVLDGFTERAEYGNVTTVSKSTEECANLSEELQGFLTNYPDCFSLSQRNLSRNFDPRTYFVLWEIDAWVYQLRIASRELYEVTDLNYIIGDQKPKYIPIVLEVNQDYAQPQRKRRGAEPGAQEYPFSPIYRKLYDPVYVSRASPEIITFDLDPPVLASSSNRWLVSVVDPEQQYYPNEPTERIITNPEFLSLSCTSTTEPTCTDSIVQGWSQALQQYTAAGCNSKRSNRLLLETYKFCKRISTAGPTILVSPSSVDVGQGLPIIRRGYALATLDCYVENAVEYRWYRTAPSERETYFRSGNQLVFRSADELDLVQGAYVCEGIGGKPYENVTVRTEPATVTITESTTFKVTMKLLNRSYTEELADSTSPRFQELRSEIEQVLEPVILGLREELGFRYNIRSLVSAFYSGSVLAEFLVFIRVQNLSDTMRDSALHDQLASAIRGRASFSSLTADPTSIDIVNLVSCPDDVLPDGNLTFPQTRFRRTAQSVNICPQLTTRAGMPRAYRDCVGDFITQPYWEKPVVFGCFGGGIALDDLANISVTIENAEDVAKEVAILTTNVTEIGPMAITSVAGILEKLVAVNSTSTAVAFSFVATVNNILNVDEQSTFDEAANDNSPSRIILALEAYVSAMQLSGAGNFTEVRSNIAVQALLIPRSSLSNGLGFASLRNDSGTDELTENQISLFSERDARSETETSIFLPGEILEQVPKDKGDNVPISFFLYQNSRLFRSPTLGDAERPEDNFRRVVGSRIIAATVEGVRIENLASPIVSEFDLVNVSNGNDSVSGVECVFWDFVLNDGFGDWSREGCRNESVTDGIVTCLCDHLTSFAVIVDVYGQTESSVALDIISKIGCGVSIVVLLITLITYLANKKLRSKRPQKILISLCFSLLGLYFIFLVGIEATASGVGCIIVAVLIHYFTLAAIAWMAVEAANMYLLFVRVLNANVPYFFLKASIAGWGLPLLVVIIVLAADYTQYENPNYCFLRPGNGIYIGQLLPIGLVLLFNFVVFTLVMRQLTCARKTVGSTSNKSQRQETIRRLQNAVAISVLLGLTWIFGLLSIFQASNFAFQVLFAICNSLQGLMIFILFCARQQEVRQIWKEMCGRKKSAYGVGTTSKTGPESSSRSGIPLSSQSTKITADSEAI